MDVAVTGSTGLIGARLVRDLTDGGHRVLRLVRPRTGDTASRDTASGDTAQWDPAAGLIDKGALEGIGAVVHLAGEGIADRRWTPAQKNRILTSRTEGTGLLATTLASLDWPPARMLSGSAIGFYGDRGDDALDETSPAGGGFTAEVCVQWEQAAAPAESAGIATVMLRTGIVLATEAGALAKQLPYFRAGLGGRSGSGRQYLSWISLDDEIAAITWLLGSGLSGPVNLTAPNPVTNAEWAKTLGHALHRPTTIIPMIGPRILYGRELADNLLLASARVLPTRLTADGFEFSHPTLDVALAAVLGRRAAR